MEPTPGRSWRRLLRPVWIVPAVAVLVLGGTTTWWLSRGPVSEKEARRRAAATAAAKSAAFADLLAKVRLEENPMAFVEARAGKEDPQSVTELIQAYASWASRGDALEARRLIVKQLLENPNLKVGVDALLRAVALDTTPRKQDPMWKDLVEGVGKQWDAVSVNWARDLVHIENNPKTKDLVLESLANVKPEKIGPDQQKMLVNDLIDVYPTASADQKPAVEKALSAMAGPDVVEALNSRGIMEGSAPLASIQQINKELETSKQQYKKVLEQIEKEEREAQETNAREAAKSKNR